MGFKNAVWDLLKYIHGLILTPFVEDGGNFCLWWEAKNRLVWSFKADGVIQFPDDIDDEDDLHELSKVSCQKTITERSFAGHPMDQHTAMVGIYASVG